MMARLCAKKLANKNTEKSVRKIAEASSLLNARVLRFEMVAHLKPKSSMLRLHTVVASSDPKNIDTGHPEEEHALV